MIQLFKSFSIYLMPLLLTLGAVLILKHSIGNSYPYNLMIPKSILLLFLIVSAYLLIKKQNYTLVISLFSASFLGASVWAMFGTQTILGGIGGDNGFAMAMVAKFMHTNNSQDITYQNLSNFYPFYFYYLVAKLAILLDISYYKALKYGAFLTIYTMPIIIYLFWTKLYQKERAFLMTLATLSLLPFAMYFRKSYELISLVIIIPWWIYYFSIASKVRTNAFIGGLIGGVLFGFFYYWFFPLVLATLWIIINNFSNFRKNIRYYLLFLGSFLLSASFYLFPYIIDLMQFGSEPFQNRYFLASHLHFPLENINSLKEFFYLGGLVYLLYAQKNAIEKHLLILLTSGYVWVFLGHIGIINHTPLLTVKIVVFINLLLALGFVLALYALAQKIKNSIPILSFALLVLMINPLFTQIAHTYQSDELKKAKEFSPPSHYLDQKSINLFADKTILADRSRMVLSPNRPIYYFTTWSSCYTHPASQLSKRLEFLTLLQQSRDSDFIAWILRNNRFIPLEFVWFKDNTYKILLDNFPHQNIYKHFSLHFDRSFFQALSKVDGYKELYAIPKNPKPLSIENLGMLEQTIYKKFSNTKGEDEK